MKKILTINNLLIVILLAAALLRFWNLGSIPPSLTQDEAALGYNAYSILKTGRDEYGKILPLIFKSFGDYKPGLYIYADIPFVWIFGLNEVSTRLPSAIAGVISVYLIYLICKKLFDEKIAIAASLLASVNPWLIYFSRGAWEANLSLTFTLAGIYFFINSLKKNWEIILSSLFFSLTLLTYQGAKLATLVVVASLVFGYWRDFWKIAKKYLISSLFLGIIISSPIFLSFFNGTTGRLDVFSIFSYPRPTDYIQSFLKEGNEKIGDINYYLFHSETLNFARGILGRYFNHFSARFLFFEGDYQNPQHSAPYQGMFLITDLPILFLGLFAFIRKGSSKEAIFIWFWLLLAPLPAILSRDQVQSVRSLNFAIPLIVLLSFGIIFIFDWIRAHKGSIIYLIFFFLFLTTGLIYFFDAYFVHLSKHNSQYWNFGYKQIVQFVTPIQTKYSNIKVQQSFAQPYIYFLFYQKYDPTKYQKHANLSVGTNVSDVGLVNILDNIEFTSINWSVDKNDKNTLLIADPITLPEDAGLIDKINYLDGRTVAFKIVETK